MSDTVLTSEPVVTVTDHPGTGTAETSMVSQEETKGSAAPETTSPEAGASSERTEDGQERSGSRRWTKIDEIRELRASRRQERQARESLQAELSQLRQQIEEYRQFGQPGQGRPARTPADFWQDPEGSLARSMDERLETLEGRLMDRIAMTREQEAFASQIRQEQESAVEFIRSQANYAPEDDEDLIDIIESIPAQTRVSLSPQWVAEYAWMKLMQERGVSDRSTARARASTVIGQPPGPGLSGKIYSKAEFDNLVDALEKQGQNADPKLLKELEMAVREGRVKNL
ncbi:MAG: hypothetical protein C5B54_11370 [Acidobacteria bacterium]|nr:MAG: hypothetical protein C5B54_11370 [Acidobacteriota bacterium]